MLKVPVQEPVTCSVALGRALLIAACRPAFAQFTLIAAAALAGPAPANMAATARTARQPPSPPAAGTRQSPLEQRKR